MKHLHFSALAAGLLVLALATAGLARADDSPAAIQNVLRERIDTGKKSTGAVVGIIDAKGPRITAYGTTAAGGSPVDGDTVFEIGSISKTFTAALLADMVRRGEVALDDPISKYLPATVKTPKRDGREITLLDLATQTSGLPRMPSNFAPKDRQNPYADYTAEQMYAFLSSYELTREIGSKYEYSNLGVGLLGHVLARRAGVDFATLVQQRITGPLGMNSTAIVLTPAMQSRLALGHNRTLARVPGWDMDVLAGAGAIRSTVNDMLKYAAANLGLPAAEPKLSAAMQTAHTARRPAGQPNMQIGLNWHLLKRGAVELVEHNGQSGGYHAYLGMDKTSGKAVVVLANGANNFDDIGRHLLSAEFPLTKVEAPPVAITLPEASLAQYVGKYLLGASTVVEVTRTGDKLFLQLPGQRPLEMLAKSELEFFMSVADVRIVFTKSDTGAIADLTIRQMGRDQKAVRQP